jgi:hypothetical protein
MGRTFDLEAKGLLSGLEIAMSVPENVCWRLHGTTGPLHVESALRPIDRRRRFRGNRLEIAQDGMGLSGNLVTDVSG